jgi:carbamoyltransferase
MRDRLNQLVKFREFFRPYGAIVRAEHQTTVFDVANKYGLGPYMSFVVPVRPSWRDRIPALVHHDGTCRVQVVRSEDVFLLDVLSAFEARTSVPVLINTSLNIKGQPMARTPEDALSVFIASAVDHLVFNEEILVSK